MKSDKPVITNLTKEPTDAENASKDSKVLEADINSIAATAAGLEYGSVMREMRRAWARRVLYYIEDEGMLPQEAVVRADDPQPDSTTEEEYRRIMRMPINSISWWALSIIFERDPALASQLWAEIKEEARNEFVSGNRAAGGLEVVEWQQDPWARAQCLAIREGFVEEWQPKGAIELALIDMMTQSFSQYLYWNEVVYRRSTTETLLSKSERELQKEFKDRWYPPRVNEQEAIDHAATMTDRFNKLFLRTLRQLRDLRRYQIPVTINNPQQVNIAADGGQQVNLSGNPKDDKR